MKRFRRNRDTDVVDVYAVRSGRVGFWSRVLSHPAWSNPKLLINLVVVVMTSTALIVFTFRNDFTQSEKNAGLHQMVGIAKATGAAPPDWHFAPSSTGSTPTSSSSGQKVIVRPMSEEIEIPPRKRKTVETVMPTSWDCSNPKTVESDFMKAKEEQIDANTQSVEVSSGCVVTVFNGAVSGMDPSSKGYMLAVAYPMGAQVSPGVVNTGNPQWYHRCGDFGGNNNTTEECGRFVSTFSGQRMIVIVKDDGHVKIN